jgi:hypothetical protein
MIDELKINKDVKEAVLALRNMRRDTDENHGRPYPGRPYTDIGRLQTVGLRIL